MTGYVARVLGNRDREVSRVFERRVVDRELGSDSVTVSLTRTICVDEASACHVVD